MQLSEDHLVIFLEIYSYPKIISEPFLGIYNYPNLISFHFSKYTAIKA